MSEVVHCKASEFPGLLEGHLRKLERRAHRGMEQTARDGVAVVKSEAPKAFGDLRGSTHVEKMGRNVKIVVDAPHAGAVEGGSAPHTPDIERLTAWVRLRGMQGLRGVGSSRTTGMTTGGHAMSVKEELASRVQNGAGGQFSPIDAPRQVAEAIAKSIQVNGTRPYFFVRNSLPRIEEQLGRNMRAAMRK